MRHCSTLLMKGALIVWGKEYIYCKLTLSDQALVTAARLIGESIEKK